MMLYVRKASKNINEKSNLQQLTERVVELLAHFVVVGSSYLQTYLSPTHAGNAARAAINKEQESCSRISR